MKLQKKNTDSSWIKVTRLARYLKGRPRSTLKFAKTHERSHIFSVVVDMDCVGNTKTHAPTFGGEVITLQQSTLVHWSMTQARMPLSSAEAGVIAMTKGSMEAIRANKNILRTDSLSVHAITILELVTSE